MLRSLILISGISVFTLNSCDKPSLKEPIDTSYLDGLVGNYSIECQISYTDMNGFYQYVDTSYIGSLVSGTEDNLLLDFFDGSSVELEFTYNHEVRTECSSNNYVFYLGNWKVVDNIPSIEVNQIYSSCIEGFSGTSIELMLNAIKL